MKSIDNFGPYIKNTCERDMHAMVLVKTFLYIVSLNSIRMYNISFKQKHI